MLFTARAFRVYFNRMGAAPLIWCVAPASCEWELCVGSVEIRVPCATRFESKATSDDDDGKPSAWIEATGVLAVDKGHAVIGAA